MHRDLKLENILLDRYENVKLVDFGFTREYSGRTNHLQTFCGTICYAAPEMLKGEKYAGEKVDVWSLGIILYALLCGELPFDDDDDNVTRSKILAEEPKYPEHLSTDALSLLKSLLSKRPLPRPSLPNILVHPFLNEHAAAQQAVLDDKVQAPFASALEMECLHRMKSAGVDVDAVTESVVAQRCDALAGWWTLLLEKEQRKMQRRERKRREKELEKSLHRLSAASSRLDRLAPSLQHVNEDGGIGGHSTRAGEYGSRRGRSKRRSTHNYGELTVTDLPLLVESGKTHEEVPPTPVDKDSIRSVSTSRTHRPVPPPKEGVIRGARSRGSTLHLVTTSDALGAGNNGSATQAHEQDVPTKTKKKPSQALMAHWKSLSHWFLENTTKRRRGHERRKSRSTPDLHLKQSNTSGAKDNPRPQTGKHPTSSQGNGGFQTAPLPKGVVANGRMKSLSNGQSSIPARTPSGSSSLRASLYSRPPRSRIGQSASYKRQSLSPGARTHRSSIRRSSIGLRGRKSTSSSVSSVRSMHHHHHSHSKASSTSSTGSVSTSKTPLGRGHSPHHSVKILPATPTGNSFPSNIRLVRGSPAPPPLRLYDEGMPREVPRAPGSPNPFSSGILFAKRKRNIFKGPSLSFGGVGHHSSRNINSTSHSRNGSGSALGRRSGEITGIQEEDEEPPTDAGDLEEIDDDADEVEEVDSFQPIVGLPGEIIEEQILEDDTHSTGVSKLPVKEAAKGPASSHSDRGP